MAVSGSMPPSQEARAHHASQLQSSPAGTAWTGWVSFAAIVIVMLGAINLFQGMLALFDEGYFAVAGEQLVLVNYDAWGVLILLWGGALMLVGLGLAGGRGVARWLAIGLVLLNVIVQIGFFPAQPFLSSLLIGLDVVVLFALTARWEEAQRGF